MNDSVIVLGSSTFEIFAISKYFKPDKSNVENTLSFQHDSQLWLDNAIHEPGGNGLISAITLARQGIQTSLCSMVGKDSFGKALKDILLEESIDSSNFHQTPAHNTDVNIHLGYLGQQETTFHYPGSFLSLEKKHFPKKLSYWLHVATLPPEKTTLVALKKLLKNYNGIVSMHPRFIHALPTRTLTKLLKLSTWVFLNRDEASMFLGGFFTMQEAAIKLHNVGIKHCVVYDGHNGCVVTNNDTLYHAAGYSKNKPLNNIGAEDSFAAGFIASCMQNQSIENAISAGLAQSDSVMGIVGSRAAILQNPVLKQIKITKTTI